MSYFNAVRRKMKYLWGAGIIVSIMVAGSSTTAFALDIGGGELNVTPRLLMGTVAWSQLRQEGGHKSMAALETVVEYQRRDWVLALMGHKWWVSEGMDSNQGMMAEEGYRIGFEVRRLFDVGDGFTLFPFASLGYEEWDRDELDPQAWSTLDFMNGVVGLGLDHERGYIKAGVGHAFAASANNEESDPDGRVGFESEAGLRLSNWTVGLFWRGAGFQEPDAKLIQTGTFLSYTF